MKTILGIFVSISVIFKLSPSKLSVKGEYTYTHEPDKDIHMKCPSTEALYFMGGTYHTHNHDRQYTFKCKKISTYDHTECSWTDWENNLGEKLDFRCPDNKFITAIESYHTGPEDRRWKFKCCKNNEIKLTNCEKTNDFVNNIGEPFTLEESTRIINGLESVYEATYIFGGYSHSYNDRKWKIERCEYRRESSFSCQFGEAFYTIQGTYNEALLDRYWTYACRKITDFETSCYWTIEYLNAFNQELNFGCRTNHYFAGVYSYSSEWARDRRYKIRCCTAKNIDIIYDTCQNSDYINGFRDEINHQIPSGSIYIGMESYHDSNQEDRRWKFETCKYSLDKTEIKCPDKHGLYKFHSTYNVAKLDRDWEWHCKEVSVESFSDCYWTEYLNEADLHLKGNCHGNNVLSGIRSYHDVHTRDRRWKIRCCTSDRLILDFCKKGTEAINDYRDTIDYATSGVITGLESDHNNEKEDRVWKVNTCQFWTRYYSIECPDGHGVFLMQSKYYKKEKDRIWDFKCLRVADTFNDDCYWIGKGDYLNEADLALDAKCDPGYVIRGIKSLFSDHHRDRQWNVKCCRNNNAILSECETTPRPINQLQQNIVFEVNFNHVLTGLESTHDDYSEDRRWKVTYCKFQCCQ